MNGPERSSQAGRESRLGLKRRPRVSFFVLAVCGVFVGYLVGKYVPSIHPATIDSRWWSVAYSGTNTVLLFILVAARHYELVRLEKITTGLMIVSLTVGVYACQSILTRST